MRQALVVEIEPTVRCILAKILLNAGYGVVEAYDAEEGVDLLDREQPDLIVTSLFAARPGGLGFLHAIQQSSRHPRVIALADEIPGVPRIYQTEIAAKFGVDALVYTPLHPEELLDVILCSDDMTQEAGRSYCPNPSVQRPAQFGATSWATINVAPVQL
jgi:CheY-like chemotaxis protein